MPYSISLASPTGKLEKPGSTTYSLNLKSIPAPQPGPHDLLVRISAAALNHRDVFSRRGLYPGVALDVPLLADGTGVVVGAGSAVPPAVRERWQGRRVVLAPARGWAAAPAAPEQPDEPGAERDGVGKVHPFAILGGTRFYPNGTLQNFVSVDAGQVEEAPAHLTDAEAAALPLAGLTAWRALVSKAGVRDARANGGTGSGDAVLITGIGGGVALAALQFAVARGASVVVTSSSPAKIEAAVRMGALGGVDYRQRGWAKAALGLLPEEKKKAGGFDAAIDGAGGDLMREVAGVMKPGGAITVYGMTTSPNLPVPMAAVLRNLELRTSTMGSRRELNDMLKFVHEHGIRPVISRVVDGIDNIAGIEDLFAVMDRGGQFGKLVIRVRGEGEESRL